MSELWCAAASVVCWINFEYGHRRTLVGAGDAPEALVLEYYQRPEALVLEYYQRPEGAFLETFTILSACPILCIVVSDCGSYHRRVQRSSSCKGDAPGGANQAGECFGAL